MSLTPNQANRAAARLQQAEDEAAIAFGFTAAAFVSQPQVWRMFMVWCNSHSAMPMLASNPAEVAPLVANLQRKMLGQ